MTVEKRKSLNYLKADNHKLLVDKNFDNTYSVVVCIDKFVDNFTEYDEDEALALVEAHRIEEIESEALEVETDVVDSDAEAFDK
jgi:hypothetical protein